MAAGTRGDEHVGRRSGYAAGARSPREIVRGLPDAAVDGYVGERAGEVAQDPVFLSPAGTVPQLELNRRAPAGLPGPQRGVDAAADLRVTLRTQEVYPGRRVDENQRLNPGAVRLATPAASSDRRRCPRIW